MGACGEWTSPGAAAGARMSDRRPQAYPCFRANSSMNPARALAPSTGMAL
jgi:hypothetical protein